MVVYAKDYSKFPQSLFQSESKNSKLKKTDILHKDFLNSLIIQEEKDKRNHYREVALDM